MDVVWSRLEGYPWWPGVLLTDEERLACGVQLPEDGTYNALVKNFGTHDVTPVDKNDVATLQPFFTSSTISRESVDSGKLHEAQYYTQDATLSLAVQEAFAHSGLVAMGQEWMAEVGSRRHVGEEDDDDENLLKLGDMSASKAEMGEAVNEDKTDDEDGDAASMEEGEGLSSKKPEKSKKEKRKHKKLKKEKKEKRKKEEMREHRKRDREDNDDDDDDARIRRRRRVIRETTRSVALKGDTIEDRRKRAHKKRSRGTSRAEAAHRDRDGGNDSDDDTVHQHDSAYVEAITYEKRRAGTVELEGIRDGLVAAMEAGNIGETRALMRVLCDLEVSYKQLVFTGIGVVVGELLNTSHEFVALSQFYSIALALLECWFHRLDGGHKKALICQVMAEKQEGERRRAVYRQLEDDDLGAYIQEMPNDEDLRAQEEHQGNVTQEQMLETLVV